MKNSTWGDEAGLCVLHSALFQTSISLSCQFEMLSRCITEDCSDKDTVSAAELLITVLVVKSPPSMQGGLCAGEW